MPSWNRIPVVAVSAAADAGVSARPLLVMFVLVGTFLVPVFWSF